jgi:hypothetical protein
MQTQHSSKLPQSLSDKYVELININQAIDEYEHGQPVTALCPTCGEPLTVGYVEQVRTLRVTCPNGCINYCERRART